MTNAADQEQPHKPDQNASYGKEATDLLTSPPAGYRTLPARSRKQAFDWSLVLASQGIRTTIVHSSDSKRWGLWVPQPELQHATRSLKQYHLENKGWEGQLRVTPSREDAVFHWASLLWCFCIGAFYLIQVWYSPMMKSAGLMDNIALQHGEWWRLFTAITLHADVGHLAANLTMGFFLIGLVMPRYGVGTSLLATFLAGALGNVAGLAIYGPEHRSLGASGMVLAALGLLAVLPISTPMNNAQAWRSLISGLSAGVMLFVLMGLSPESDLVAHFGGFLGGAILGAPILWARRYFRHQDWHELIALLLLIGLVIVSWGYALGPGKIKALLGSAMALALPDIGYAASSISLEYFP